MFFSIFFFFNTENLGTFWPFKQSYNLEECDERKVVTLHAAKEVTFRGEKAW